MVDRCHGLGGVRPPQAKLHRLVRRLQVGSSGWKRGTVTSSKRRRKEAGLSGGRRLSRLAVSRTGFKSPLASASEE